MSQNGTSAGVNGHSHEHHGPNFCPNCGCNIKAIALAMLFAANMGKPIHSAKARPVAARAHPPLKPEQKAKIMELRAKKMSGSKIAEALHLPESQVSYVIYAKPKTSTRVNPRVPTHSRSN